MAKEMILKRKQRLREGQLAGIIYPYWPKLQECFRFRGSLHLRFYYSNPPDIFDEHDRLLCDLTGDWTDKFPDLADLRLCEGSSSQVISVPPPSFHELANLMEEKP